MEPTWPTHCSPSVYLSALKIPKKKRGVFFILKTEEKKRKEKLTPSHSSRQIHLLKQRKLSNKRLGLRIRISPFALPAHPRTGVEGRAGRIGETVLRIC